MQIIFPILRGLSRYKQIPCRQHLEFSMRLVLTRLGLSPKVRTLILSHYRACRLPDTGR